MSDDMSDDMRGDLDDSASNPAHAGFESSQPCHQGTSRKYPSFDESRIRNETIQEIAHSAVTYQ